MAQWIRHLTTNQGIPGSSPVGVVIFSLNVCLHLFVRVLNIHKSNRQRKIFGVKNRQRLLPIVQRFSNRREVYGTISFVVLYPSIIWTFSISQLKKIVSVSFWTMSEIIVLNLEGHVDGPVAQTIKHLCKSKVIGSSFSCVVIFGINFSICLFVF